MSIAILQNKQNPDGGWAYGGKSSWTEPTAYAVMACMAAGEKETARRGIEWLRSAQRPDGSWPPQLAVDEGAWVTSLVALLPPETLGRERHARAVGWLLDVTGVETTGIYRIREWMLGNKAPDPSLSGWPWVPGSSAWVGPTSLAMLALSKEHRRKPDAAIARRLEFGRRFLLDRSCREGGWNHGSVRALGYESSPYPETTGMALAALAGVRAPEVVRAIPKALGFLEGCRSANAACWLRLGLVAHGALPESYRPPAMPVRTACDLALNLLLNSTPSAAGVFLA